MSGVLTCTSDILHDGVRRGRSRPQGQSKTIGMARNPTQGRGGRVVSKVRQGCLSYQYCGAVWRWNCRFNGNIHMNVLSGTDATQDAAWWLDRYLEA